MTPLHVLREGETVIHRIDYANIEKRAGRTRCGRYLEFWPSDIVAGEDGATCLECVVMSLPPLTPGLVMSDDAAVDERGDDIAQYCGASHMAALDVNGRCARCGYGQRG
jgi:hypothetical protein